MQADVSPPDDDAGLPGPGELVGGKFRIERLVGRGGMGAVFAAQHELLGQRVAIKMLLSQVATSREAVARFLNEARAASRIAGEHVARVMDVATLDDGRPYMVIEYLDGADLAHLLASRGPFPVVEAVDCILQSLEALAQAHALGIVHRDFKPSNLFLAQRADGTSIVKVLDFGIAKATQPLSAQEHTEMTRSNAVLGSPQYMAPEQLRNAKSVDVRTDIWSVGLTLYELVTGLTPFSGASFGELFAAILEQTPAPLRSSRPEIDPDLDALVGRCLRRNPADRFQNVSELARALVRHGSPRAAFSLERIVSWLPPPLTPAPVPTPTTAPAAEADPHGATVLGGTAATDPHAAAVLGRSAAEATAPPLSNTKSSGAPGRKATIVTGTLIAVVAIGGGAAALLRSHAPDGARVTANATQASAILGTSLSSAGPAPAALVSIAPAEPAAPARPGPSARSDRPPLPVRVSAEPPRPAVRVAAAVSSTASSTPPAPLPPVASAPAVSSPALARAPAASSPGPARAPVVSTHAPAPAASAPTPRSRVDQTGLAGENPF